MSRVSGPSCRWGILGTAKIARKNWQAIHHAGNGTLVAVASRSVERAKQFISDCQAHVPYPRAPRAATYDELLSSPDIDAVYIPLPTALRKSWVVRAAEAGKHVVCEKPCGVNAAEVAEMLAACRAHNVQFMDGVMFLHSRRMDSIRETLEDESSIGEIRRIVSQFSFHGGEEFLRTNIRANSQLEPLGCLGDLGWYNIRFALWVMNHQRPDRVSGRLLRATAVDGAPAPLEFSGELLFPGGVSATFYCSFVTALQQWADVSGSKGRLFVQDFVLPYQGGQATFNVWNDVFAINNCQFDMQQQRRRVGIREDGNNAPSAQESNLFRRFGELVLSGQVDAQWGESVLLTQQVLDACLVSSGSEGRLVALA